MPLNAQSQTQVCALGFSFLESLADVLTGGTYVKVSSHSWAADILCTWSPHSSCSASSWVTAVVLNYGSSYLISEKLDLALNWLSFQVRVMTAFVAIEWFEVIWGVHSQLYSSSCFRRSSNCKMMQTGEVDLQAFSFFPSSKCSKNLLSHRSDIS